MSMNRTLLPGLAVLAVIGLAGQALAALVPGVDGLIVTICIGIVVGNGLGIPDWAHPGVDTHKLWLEVGIVVMGARVALDRILTAGPVILALVVGTVVVTVLLVETLARVVYSIPEEIGTLLAAGSGICGVSAVVAVAESIDIDDSDIAYAATTVLLFDSATIFVYPLVGHLLDLSSPVFGVWAGLTMFSTGPVTAAGFAFSKAAGQWALVVKLARNSLIGVAAIIYAVVYGRRDDEPTASARPSHWQFFWETFPKFVFGFLTVMLIANVGVLDGAQITSLSHASNYAFLLAFAGVGLEFQLEELRETGYQPVLTVLSGLVIMSTTVLVLVELLF